MTPAQPLPGRARTAAEPSPLRAESAPPSPPVSGAAAGPGYRQPRGQVGNSGQGKGSESLLPALLRGTRRLVSLGLRIFPRISTRAPGVATAVWELNWGEKSRTAEKECLGNTGLKSFAFVSQRTDRCTWFYVQCSIKIERGSAVTVSIA